MIRMFQKLLRRVAFLIGFALIDAILALFYFWFAQLSYGLWITSSSLTLPVALRYGEFHWNGPGPFVFIGLGILSPLITFLPLTPLLLLFRKSPFWIRGCFCLFWLGEIAVLGFFIPRVSFL